MGVAQQVKPVVAESFTKFGVLLTDFQIESISLPPEIEKAMDERAKIGAMGGMQNFVQAQAAYAMRDAAQNPGGMAGLGAGVGAGIGVGQMMGQAMQGMFAGGFGAPAAPAAPAAAPAAPAAAPAAPSIADRLKQLKELHAGGLIDDATFAAKRDAILAEI